MGWTNRLKSLRTDSVIKKRKCSFVGSTIAERNLPGRKTNLQE